MGWRYYLPRSINWYLTECRLLAPRPSADLSLISPEHRAAVVTGESARARRAAPPAARDSGKPSRWNLPGTGGAPRRPPAPSTSPANKQPKPSQGASVKETATPSSRKAADAGRSSPSRPASGTRSRPACASPGRATGKNSRVKIFSGGAEDNVDKLYHRLSGVNDGILV